MINNIQLETVFKNLDEEELEEIKTSIETELRERKERKKDKAVQNFLHSFNELKKLNIDVYAHETWVEEDDFDFD